MLVPIDNITPEQKEILVSAFNINAEREKKFIIARLEHNMNNILKWRGIPEKIFIEAKWSLKYIHEFEKKE